MIRKITEKDHDTYVTMACRFYFSDAVLHSVSPENFELTFNELMQSDDYASGYMILHDDIACGYALLSKTFSQEAGGMVLWLEELYILPQYRCFGLGSEFLSWLNENRGSDIRRIRLEVESENVGAIDLYKRRGFEFFGYLQMIKEF